MDKLMEIADQLAIAANASNSTPSINDFNWELFDGFMQKNPIWDFYQGLKDEYLPKSNEETFSLLSKCYRHMKNGEKSFLFILFVLLLSGSLS